MSATANKKRTGKKWPWVMGMILVAIIVLAVVIPRPRPSTGQDIREVKVEKGSIVTTVVGTGRLAYDDIVENKAPKGIKINQVLVEEGEVVAKGQTIATLNATSVRLALDEAKASLDEIDRAISVETKKSDTDILRSSVSGRVKKIFVEKGDVAREKYESAGALLLISLDGKMSVEFKSMAGLSVGDKVDIIRENGNRREGEIVEANDAHFTATLSDNGPKFDEPVKIKSKNGEEIGQGKLVIHQPLSIVSLDGEVSKIHVVENESVFIGKALLTLDNIPITSTYESLIDKRAEQLEVIDELLALSKTNAIVADQPGVVIHLYLQDGATIGEVLKSSTINAQSSLNSQSLPNAQSSPMEQKSADDPRAVVVELAPDSTYAIDVEIDELDILSVKVGQPVSLAMEAINGGRFTGEIVKVDDGSSSGVGEIAKYKVKVILPRDEKMRVGMQVTATVQVDEKKDILLLPINALFESAGRVFAYTSKNERTDNLEGDVDVKTGISDGIRVEIVSGLKEGDRVYFKAVTSEFPFAFGGPGGRRRDSNTSQPTR